MCKSTEINGLTYSETELVATREILKKYSDAILHYDKCDILLKSRKRPIPDYVKIFCHHLHNNLRYTVSRIGVFINRDHATVCHACKQYYNLYSIDPAFKKKANFFMQVFSNIDGILPKEPNKNYLTSLIQDASEQKRGEWHYMITMSEMAKQSPVDYERV